MFAVFARNRDADYKTNLGVQAESAYSWRIVREPAAGGKLGSMNWAAICIILAVLAAVILLKRASQITSKEALAHLKSGALVIDVRTPSESGCPSLDDRAEVSLRPYGAERA
jgi:hypothetical protein